MNQVIHEDNSLFVDVLTIGAGSTGPTDNEEEIPSIAELIQMEKQRLADVETQQQYPNVTRVASILKRCGWTFFKGRYECKMFCICCELLYIYVGDNDSSKLT